jgi:hypothetical protein
VLLSTSAWADITSNLAGRWLLNETSGAGTAEDSIGTNDGTLTQMNTATAWVTGKYGNGLQFDGSNDYVLLSSVYTLTPLTICAWVNQPSNKWVGLVTLKQDDGVSWDHRTVLKLSNTGQVIAASNASTGDQAATTTATLTLNTWQHACGVWSATNARRAYLNGGNEATNGATVTPNTPTRTLFGVVVVANAEDHFNGILDEVYLFTRALSAGDIAELYAYTGAPAKKRLFILSQRLRWWVGSAAVARVWGGPALWRYGARALVALEGR